MSNYTYLRNTPVLIQTLPHYSKCHHSFHYMGNPLWNSLQVNFRNTELYYYKRELETLVLQYN